MSATTKRNLLLTEANDLDISGGTLHFAAGLQAVKQAVRSSILLVLGEWFLNTDEGTDWRGLIFVKNPNVILIRNELRERIMRVPGVKTLDSLDLTFDRAARTLSVDFSATCDFGEFDDTVAVS